MVSLEQAWNPHLVQIAALDADAYRALLPHLRCIKGDSERAALQLAQALEAYLDGRCRDVSKKLGIGVPRGGRFKVPAVVAAMAGRDELIRQAIEMHPAGARGVQAACSTPASTTGNDALDSVIRRLLAEYKVPNTVRALRSASQRARRA